MKKLLITDLDDTLYDWLGFFIPAFYAMLDEIIEITGINREILLKEFKIVHQQYGSVEYPFSALELPSILKKYNGKTTVEIKEILGEAFHQFNSVRKHNLCLYDGVSETLKLLYEKGITIIGYTESAQENGFYRLKKLGISQYFKHVYATESQYKNEFVSDDKIMTVRTKKPDKDVLLGICNRENCHPNEVIYIGDSLTKDIYMAGTAGITSVWINHPKEKNNYYDLLVDITSWTEDDFVREFNLKQEFSKSNMKPDYTIHNFKELLDIFI